MTAGVSSAEGGATLRASEAASPSVATAQAITEQVTTNGMSWDSWQSRDQSAAARWRCALIATAIISR